MGTSNPCIKTGAQVYFQDYEQQLSADVYKVGDTYIIRTNANQLYDQYAPHVMSRAWDIRVCSTNGPNEFWRPDIGVFVVAPDMIVFNEVTMKF